MKLFVLFSILWISIQISSSQDKGLFLGADYSWRTDVSGFGVNIGVNGFNNKELGIHGAVGGGAAFGNYTGGLSNSTIKGYVYDQMTGSTYISHDTPDDVNGGWYLNASLLFLKRFHDAKFSVLIGPRVNYFSKQSVSVLNESQDNQYIYTEFAEVPYRDAQWIPGLEVNMLFGDFLMLKYAYMSKGNYEKNMHMFGLAFFITSLR